MRRIILFTIVVIASSNLVFTQPLLKPQVIATAGNSSFVGNYYLSYTIGQVIAFTGQTQNTILTQGFQQPSVCMPYQNEEICIVLVDSTTNKNLIVWEKTPNVATDYYKIWKELLSTQWDLIGTVPYNDLSQFTDTSSHPQQLSARYKISVVDTCGIESQMSTAHRTLHLSVSQGFPTGVQLSWVDNYEGFAFTTYQCYRIYNTGVIDPFLQIQNTLTSYTDLTPPAETVKYFIAAIKPGTPCNPIGAKDMTGPFSQSLSNIEDNGSIYKIANNQFNNSIKIYPNPATDEIIIETLQNIKTNGMTCEISNTEGQIIRKLYLKNQKTKIDIKELNRGFYTIKIKSDNEITIKKLVKQ